jgi:hypothetical protein
MLSRTYDILSRYHRNFRSHGRTGMSKAERDAFFNGTKAENGKTLNRGIISIRGIKAAEDLNALTQRLMDVRASRGIKT